MPPHASSRLQLLAAGKSTLLLPLPAAGGARAKRGPRCSAAGDANAAAPGERLGRQAAVVKPQKLPPAPFPTVGGAATRRPRPGEPRGSSGCVIERLRARPLPLKRARSAAQAPPPWGPAERPASRGGAAAARQARSMQHAAARLTGCADGGVRKGGKVTTQKGRRRGLAPRSLDHGGAARPWRRVSRPLAAPRRAAAVRRRRGEASGGAPAGVSTSWGKLSQRGADGPAAAIQSEEGAHKLSASVTSHGCTGRGRSAVIPARSRVLHVQRALSSGGSGRGAAGSSKGAAPLACSSGEQAHGSRLDCAHSVRRHAHRCSRRTGGQRHRVCKAEDMVRSGRCKKVGVYFW